MQSIKICQKVAGSLSALAIIVCFSLISILSLNTALFAESFLKKGVPSFVKESATSVGPAPFSNLARYISHSVVNISSEADEDKDNEDNEDAEQEHPELPFFKRGPSPFRSLGSGFIVNSEGFIVTNNHVIGKADKVIVRLVDDKTEYEAEIIGRDLKTDLALIKITPKQELKPVLIGDSDKIEVGEWVVAIGNQFQLGQTVTAGIVSAKARRVPTRFSGPYDQFIQTDASINPGSSGGPLVNAKGQVIGINTAIFSPGRHQIGGTGFNIGIGFAIPINLVVDIVKQLKEGGKVTRGLLGVIIQSIDADLAEVLKLESPYGALVADVMTGSPAKEAGFRRRDVIISYNGLPVREHDDLPLMVASTDIGTLATIEVIRDGKKLTLKPRIEELKDSSFVDVKEEPKPDRLGIIAREVSDEIAKMLGQKEAKGVLIVSVEPRSAADKAGLVRGDVIEELSSESIGNMTNYRTTLKSLEVDQRILVLVRRKEGTRFLTLVVK